MKFVRTVCVESVFLFYLGGREETLESPLGLGAVRAVGFGEDKDL